MGWWAGRWKDSLRKAWGICLPETTTTSEQTSSRQTEANSMCRTPSRKAKCESGREKATALLLRSVGRAWHVLRLPGAGLDQAEVQKCALF